MSTGARDASLTRLIPVAFRHYLIAQTVAVLASLPYTTRYSRLDSRYAFHWGPADGVTLVALIVLLGILLFLTGRFLIRTGRTGLLAGGLALALWISLAGSVHFVLSHNPPTQPLAEPVATALWAAIPLGAFPFRILKAERILRICKILCWSFSPLLLIQLGGLLLPPWYADPAEDFPAPRMDPAEKRPSVYLFVFDELSYRRLFDADRPRGRFPNFNALCADSVVFHDAHSPHEKTQISIPSILWQTDQEMSLGWSGPSFARVPCDSLPNLFSEARDRDYRTFATGFLHPYRSLVGNGLDYARAFDYYTKAGSGWLDRTAYHAANLALRIYVPFTASLRQRVHHALEVESQLTRVNRTHEEALRIVGAKDGPVFAWLHYSVPHHPHVTATEGRPEDFDPLEGYLGNIGHADRMLGEALSLLKKEGRYDSSLIVVTSDHGWRYDPDWMIPPEAKTHVPLMIKPPYSSSSTEVREPVKLSNLRPLLRRFEEARDLR